MLNLQLKLGDTQWMSTVIACAIGDLLDFEVFKQMINKNIRTQQG